MTERLFEPSRGVLGDVLVERAGQRPRGEDALDGGVVARAERDGMTEREIDLVGGVALAQEQDLAGLRAPDPRWTEAHQWQRACARRDDHPSNAPERSHTARVELITAAQEATLPE